jgi:hypothetical protein
MSTETNFKIVYSPNVFFSAGQKKIEKEERCKLQLTTGVFILKCHPQASRSHFAVSFNNESMITKQK